VNCNYELTHLPIYQLCALQEFWHLLAFAQCYVGLLPVRAAPREASLPLDLAVRDARPDVVDLGAEQLFDGAPDLHLVRARRDLKNDRPAILALDGRFLGDERLANDVGEFDHASASCNFSSAALVATTRSASATWRADRRALDTNSIRAMLRTDRDNFSSRATSTSTA